MVTVDATVPVVVTVGTVICGGVETWTVATVGGMMFASSFSSVVTAFEMKEVSRDSIWWGRATLLAGSTETAVTAAATVAAIDLFVLFNCAQNDCVVVVTTIKIIKC